MRVTALRSHAICQTFLTVRRVPSVEVGFALPVQDSAHRLTDPGPRGSFVPGGGRGLVVPAVFKTVQPG